MKLKSYRMNDYENKTKGMTMKKTKNHTKNDNHKSRLTSLSPKSRLKNIERKNR
eukprot:UN09171